jgi:hypothetical protein
MKMMIMTTRAWVARMIMKWPIMVRLTLTQEHSITDYKTASAILWQIHTPTFSSQKTVRKPSLSLSQTIKIPVARILSVY